MTAINVTAVQCLAQDVSMSGQEVLTLSSSIVSAAADFAPSQLGQDYQGWGDKLAQACTDAAGVFIQWGTCVSECGAALSQAATSYQQQDDANSDDIGATGLELAI